MRDRPTVHDVARVAGVSIKTVSRVVNEAPEVSPEMRDRVERAISEVGYVPNHFARSLKRGSADTIGVIVDSIGDPFFAALTDAIEQRALALDLNVIIGTTGYAAERERRQVERMATQQVAGIVLAPVAGDHGYLEGYRSSVPVVLVDRGVERADYDLVAVDDRGLARDAVRHLIDAGHRRIAFVGSDERFSTTSERLAGYREAMSDASLAVDDAWVCPVVAAEHDAEVAVGQLLALAAPPTAVFAPNPRAGAGVAHALHTTGHAQVGFISFGDFPLARTLHPAVTYVNQDPAAIGEAAIERLLEHIAAGERERRGQQTGAAIEPRTTVVATSLVPRGSGEVPPWRD